MAGMFLGEYRHALDDKGRVILPSQFRVARRRAVMTKQVDGCMAVWPPDEFKEQARRWPNERREDRPTATSPASFFATAGQFELTGRAASPSRHPARLRRPRPQNVVISGQFDRIEIWDVDRWHDAKQAGDGSWWPARPEDETGRTGGTRTD